MSVGTGVLRGSDSGAAPAGGGSASLEWALIGPRWVHREESQGSGVALHRDLHFSSFDTRHLHTNFTCVVLSPLGVDTREVRWPSPALAPVTGKSAGLG